MNHQAAITGLGLCTVLGSSAPATWNALLAGRSVVDHTRIVGIEDDHRATTLARHASREAIEHAGWMPRICTDESTALIVATSKGPIERWINTSNISAGPLQAFGLGCIASDIADSLGFVRGPRLTLSAACASGLHGLIRAAMMILSGEIRRALVVAVEASVHPLFIGSFDRLGVLASKGFGCRPFDETRQGFVMTDAAAAVCVESVEHLLTPSLAVIDRFALGGDATHLTGGDPTGKTLRHLLKQVIQSRPVDLIHAHGTGTILNDPNELSALESTTIGRAAIYSHKGALGHTLGASGLISIVLNCLSHKNQMIPGNCQTNTPLPSRNFTISQTALQLPVHRSLAIATGFGGPTAVVSLEK